MFPTRECGEYKHAEGMYPYHVDRVQHLGPGDFVQRLEFCKWLNGSRQLHRYILFTDEAQFNWPARSPGLSPLDYCVRGWMKELIYSVKVGTREALVGRILDATDRIRNSQRKVQRATRAVHNRACVAADGGIFENQL